jgi:uncharacterized protein (TIGR02118 family)
MILVSVFYPNDPGSRFDERYYFETHIPLVQQRWGGMGLEEVRVLRGLGAPDGGPAPWRVMAFLRWSSHEALQKALAAHGEEILGDIPNFTDTKPVLQVNEPTG